jgi:hypothetical protein
MVLLQLRCNYPAPNYPDNPFDFLQIYLSSFGRRTNGVKCYQMSASRLTSLYLHACLIGYLGCSGCLLRPFDCMCTVIKKFGHLGRIRTVEYSPKNMAEILPKWRNFAQNSTNSTFFLAEFLPIFGVKILLCGFAHFWANFGQNGLSGRIL